MLPKLVEVEIVVGCMVTDWAQAQKADEPNIHSTSGVYAEPTDKMLTRLGFKTYGGSYAARVE